MTLLLQDVASIREVLAIFYARVAGMLCASEDFFSSRATITRLRNHGTTAQIFHDHDASGIHSYPVLS